MADPLTGLLQKKKQTAVEAKAAAPAKGGLFDFDVESSLSRKIAVPVGSEQTVGEHIFDALAAGSNVDFPKVTEICERVVREPQEVAEAVRLLAGAFADGPPRRKLKALTIMNELLYNPKAADEMRLVHGVRDTLWKLQATNNSGLGTASDEQIRIFATEVEKKVFGTAGDPFATPLVPEDPFTLPQVSEPSSKAERTKDSSSMLGALWQVGAAVKDRGLAAAQEAKELLKSQGGPRLDLPKLPVRPLADRPVEDIRFDDMLPGEKVHYSINPTVLPINKPFRELQGRLLISNYRLKFQVPKGTLKDKLAWLAEKQLLDVPLGLVEKMDYEGITSEAGVQQWRFTVTSKDFRTLTFLVPQAKDLVLIEEAVLALSQPGAPYTKALFAFAYAAAAGADVGELYEAGLEFQRMGVCEKGPWKISAANSDYQLCETYPAVLVLPASTSHDQLRRVSAFRKRGRLPTLSWCHSSQASLWRCSQPMEGILGQEEKSDESMLKAIRAGQERELLVLDLRPRTAAYANKVGGGGFERYEGLRLVFGGVDNVHVVREAWKKMGQAVASLSNEEVGSWFKDVANSGWYDVMGAIFHCAKMVVHEIDVMKCNVLIHCSDGWDRTAQVSSVAMMCMDPFYRSLRGFLLLIEKEFCSFGHRFRTRLANGERPTSEYSPVFLQWLECVHQLTLQFPEAFEFSNSLLLHLSREVLSNRWGTFLGDCEKERKSQVKPATCSLWSAILAGPAPFINERYAATSETLIPSLSQVNFKVWEEYWFRFRVHPREELHERMLL